jgi:hypothetical protein
MGATHFQMKTLKNVSTEMALHVLAYNMTARANWWPADHKRPRFYTTLGHKQTS